MRLSILDRYIIKKFLSTYVFSIALIIGIAIIFDFSEKIDDFIENNAPLRAIIFDNYLNFIPYFAVLFSSLFVFISVIFFTSKMAYNTEIIAILSSGISFGRLLRPYFIAAFVITLSTWYLTNYVIPISTKKRLQYEELYYYGSHVRFNQVNIHKQVEPGVFIYMESFNNTVNVGYKFSMEYYEEEEGALLSKTFAELIRWDSTMDKWQLRNYYTRDFFPDREELQFGNMLDTSINMSPEEFRQRANVIETMTTPELREYTDLQLMQGSGNIEPTLVERYKRFSFPFSTFILTFIGVVVSSRKIRGGTGMHLGIGLLIAFSYILFMQFSTQFAIAGLVSPLLAVWIPNMIYVVVGVLLYRMFFR